MSFETAGYQLLPVLPELVLAVGAMALLMLGAYRGPGTTSLVTGLADYVRKEHAFDLMTAMRKMSLMPAQRLQGLAPMFKDKGRIRVGADADIVVFDPATVQDHADYANPAVPSTGFAFVLVDGVPVIRNAKLVDNATPGRPARAPIQQ